MEEIVRETGGLEVWKQRRDSYEEVKKLEEQPNVHSHLSFYRSSVAASRQLNREIYGMRIEILTQIRGFLVSCRIRGIRAASRLIRVEFKIGTATFCRITPKVERIPDVLGASTR
ncbi:hypothetical protein M5K25_027752 [Dendrobium thyrsiflorum]|uniref:Uncharacterized protein n=1 Tax=Dendrobium thyrsiflorum TaxID=117978 RepID=A0ABD0TUS3_DENTH